MPKFKHTEEKNHNIYLRFLYVKFTCDFMDYWLANLLLIFASKFSGYSLRTHLRVLIVTEFMAVGKIESGKDDFG